jgi:hypothetical protein
VAPSAVASSAGVLALPLVAVAVFFGSGAADPPPAGEVFCAAVPDQGEVGRLTQDTTQLNREQVDNARVIVDVARAQGLPHDAAVVALMAAYQESKLLVLANSTVPGSLSRPHQGQASNGDSVGILQQRPSMGWGSVTQLMDPTFAASAFLRALADVPQWQALPAWRAAQAVQASVDGAHYEQWESLASGIFDALADGGAGALRCSAAVGLTGPGGDFPPEACSVRPDPTTGRGCLTPRTHNLANQLVADGWRVSCWDAHEWNPDSDHPLGKACDVFPGRGGVLPSAAERAAGDDLAASLQASARRTGVAYLIWSGRQWSSARADEGWRRYNGGGAYDPGSVVGGHFDHIHVSIA